MSFNLILTAALTAPLAQTAALPTSAPEPASPRGLLAIQVAVAETMSDAGALQHAVILIEDGKIVTIGEDLPIDRGIPVLDRDPEWVVTPGLINAYSRLGLDGRAGSEFNPTGSIRAELYPKEDVYAEILKDGVTLLGLIPPGNSVPGQAAAVQPHGETKDEMILEEGTYLKIVMGSNSRAKRTLRNVWSEVEKYREKDAKAREKWEKDQEKAKKKKKDKDEEGEEEYTPLEPDPETKVLLDVEEGRKKALVGIEQSADYLHFLDALDDHEIDYALRLRLQRESDFFYVAERVGEAGVQVVCDPVITLHPGTMRQRNLPAEFARAGAKIVFTPRDDSERGLRDWRLHVAQLVAAGLERDVALRALTIEPARLLGVDDRFGSLEVEKVANLVFYNGDPLEVGTRIEAVMIDGEFVFSREEL